MNECNAVSSKRHLLTVVLEDYFQVGAFGSVVRHDYWYRFETRLERNTMRTLALLDQFGLQATFFVLGWVAERMPDIVREVARRGHEIANRGYALRGVRERTRTGFRDDLLRAHEALERASGHAIRGYRAGKPRLRRLELWTLDILAQEGYAYDSSLMPMYRTYRDEPWRRWAHRHRCGEHELWEFPYATRDVGGWLIPVAGGNFFRQWPRPFVTRALEDWDRTYDTPFVMYFHIWELDHEQPVIQAASRIARLRHYRNLDKMTAILENYFTRFRFCSIAQHLELPVAAPARTPATMTAAVGRPLTLVPDGPGIDADADGKEELTAPGLPVSVIVPCFNEQTVLPYLARTLDHVDAMLRKDYALHYIFVDDGSHDATWATLQVLFAARPNCTVLRHEQNCGVAAAILTGARHADTDIVASIDSDCTYDPAVLATLIPLLEDDVDMVTASPYHPEGGVRNVPPWRLGLSRLASWLYGLVLRQNLYTYTSCCRVYRHRAIANLDLKCRGFLGITEMLGHMALQGRRIVEGPAVLDVRLLGMSKMKVLRTMMAHLGLLSHLLRLRIQGSVARRNT
ncbi:glycosyltransferase [Candidatus Entotheonella palauensis]|uniref:glycosyltransferase n=1 Tax=Candidatus Entotheonella palauensis TaxID=93172 RepID=UPI000B7FFBD1|nr:glycosyltransferase [Candidatus Entotheonella palauensis]